MRFIFMLLISIVLLTGCGETPVDEEAVSKNEEQAKQKMEGITNENTDEQSGSEETKKEDDDNVDETESGFFRLVNGVDMQKEITSGPMKINVTRVAVVDGEAKPDYVEYYGSEKFTLIQVYMTVENTEDKNVSFYPDQATLVTNTGEQVEADLFSSGDVGGDFYGKVVKEGIVMFYLPKSKPEDIEWIKLIVSGPFDENIERLGEDIQEQIDLK